MFKLCLLINLFIGLSNGFKNIFHQRLLNHPFINPFSDGKPPSEIIYKIQTFEPLKHTFEHIEKLEKIVGYNIVKTISSILPHVDSIGHKILHADNEFITHIINMNSIPHDVKGQIILLSIKFAQYGDNFGTKILQLYYDIVEKCFE